MSDTSLILKLIEEQDEKREIQIKGVQKSMDAGFEAISIQDRKRNGRIDRNEDDIEILQNETRPTRWIFRNPGASAIILIVLLLMGAWGYHKINIKKTVENLIKIELKEDGTVQ